MHVTLLIVKYPRWAVPFAFLSMAIFRLPLMLDKNISFWKLMGSGKNGSFDIVPDFQQWSILLVHKKGDKKMIAGKPTNSSFINKYLVLFHTEITSYLLEPIEGHGSWDHKQVFGNLPKQTDYEGKIAILTRATIRFSQLKKFWKHVPLVNRQMNQANGLLTSYGVGEMPLIKQATFSIWESKAAMKTFAYSMKEHQEVIRKTHKENWYSEEMFVRFKLLNETG